MATTKTTKTKTTNKLTAAPAEKLTIETARAKCPNIKVAVMPAGAKKATIVDGTTGPSDDDMMAYFWFTWKGVRVAREASWNRIAIHVNEGRPIPD